MAVQKKVVSLIGISVACLFFASFAFVSWSSLIQDVRFGLFPSSMAACECDSKCMQSSKQNIWADLSEAEANDVLKFLFSNADLNLTEASKGGRKVNTVKLVETLQPNKTDALAYINGSSGPPQRWARVVIDEAATDEARIVNYMVGPLPPSEDTQAMPLDYCYNSRRNHVLNPVPDPTVAQAWAIAFLANNSDVVSKLLDPKTDPNSPLAINAIARISYVENGALIAWMQFYRDGGKQGAWSLLPQGLYGKIKLSKNYIEWEVLQWYYNLVLYDSLDDLRKAMKSPGFIINPLNLNGDWTETEDLSEGDPGRHKPPPVMVQPQGSRVSINKQSLVSWMGFEFFISTTSDTGVALHDIRFNGESVIYELGLQEALAHYAGDDPSQGGLEFLDTSFNMGLRMFELVPGYDCPAYATFLDAHFNEGESHSTIRNSICVFEYTADHPLQRHTSDDQVSISRNTYLIIRAVSTVGNYDYTIDYIFYLDGAIEVKVRASGYIFAAFWPVAKGEKDNEYGYRIHDAIASSMHDHVLNFKADLDIAGTANTMTRVAIEPVTLEFPWDDKVTTPRNTMHLVPYTVEKETGIDWPRNSGEMYIVTNENETNVWGEKRGYRIQPGTGMGTPAHLSILNSTTLGKSAEWAARDLWVLKQKDTEPRSASNLNFLDPLDPLVDFSKFANGEEISQEDLVLYFNLGSHHVPHSGDIPNTLMHTSASSVMFTPFNFHDRDPSRRSAQGVKLELTGLETKPRYFGGRNEEDLTLKATDLEPDLNEYRHNARGWANLTQGPAQVEKPF